MITPQQLESIEHEMRTRGLWAEYSRLIADGSSPRMAAMLAAQEAPGTKGTDAVFNRNERERMSDMDEENRTAVIEIAERAGINTKGKTYNGQLGKYHEPEAWVSGTGDVIKAAEKKKLDIRGDVNVNFAKPDEQLAELKRPKPVPDDIVERTLNESVIRDKEVAERVSKSPESRAQVKEEVRERITPTGRPLRESE